MAYTLSASVRTAKGEKIRTREVIPAVVYGAGKDSVSISLTYKEFAKIYDIAGEASLIDLKVDDIDYGKVLVHEVQYDPVSDLISHVDIKRVDMNKEITVSIGLDFVGEAPIIKEKGGTLVRNLEELEIKCLPKDLVAEINVDLSSLVAFENVIKVKDLKIPAGLEIVSPGMEDIVVKPVPALTEEQIKAMEESSKSGADLATIEVAGKKKEEEETVEGENGEEKKEEKKDEKKKEEKK